MNGGTIVGIDVGGTYTDVIAACGSRVFITKIPSTPGQPELSVLAGLRACADAGLPTGEVVHGTTLGTNAVLTRRGARVALITTAGFRDLLEMRRRDRPHTFGLHGTFHPLVPRDYRFEVSERARADGTVEQAVDPEAVVALLRSLPEPPDSIAVSFLHSYIAPANEQAVGDRLAEEGFVHTSLSHAVLPEIKEFERTSTVVVNAFLQPVMDRYLGQLSSRAAEEGLADSVSILHSNGGAMSLDLARRFPVRTVMSGPAGGVLAAVRIGERAGVRNLITCDMGGTSFDVALIVEGAPRVADEMLVEFGIPVKTTMTDVLSIGAGGGSIAWLDRANLLQIGPQSAGADPGPACYGRGGTEPTVTDANVLLNRINPERPIGEGVAHLDVDLAHEAIERVASPLGMTAEQAALAILELANLKMAGALRLVSVERGHNPDDFTVFTFGGGGPLHACALLRELGAKAALVPPYPGITSAIGCLIAEYRHDRSVTVRRHLDDIEDDWIGRRIAEECAYVTSEMEAANMPVAGAVLQVAFDAGYEGQAHTVRVPVDTLGPTSAQMAKRFEEEYTREFGGLLELPVVITSLRVVATTPRAVEFGQSSAVATEPIGSGARRPVTFREGTFDAPVLQRADLVPGHCVTGPAVIEQQDTTTLIEPGFEVEADALGNLWIRKGEADG